MTTSVEWSAAGATPPNLGTTTSAADGTFSLNVPRNLGSLDVTVTVGGTGLPLLRTVAASTTLIAPSRARSAATVTFSGRLLGRTGNLSKVPITLEAFYAGGWHTFGSAQTTSDGSWKRKIKFARVHSKYPIRAKVGRSVGYPWAAGRSKTITIAVG